MKRARRNQALPPPGATATGGGFWSELSEGTVNVPFDPQLLRVDSLHAQLLRVYVGSERFLSSSWSLTPLEGCVYLQALPGFFAHTGCTIVRGMGLERSKDGEIVPIVTHRIEVAPGTWSDIPANAMLFVLQGDRHRAVVEIDHCDDHWRICVHSAAVDPNRFYEDWQAYAKEHAYLRGRRFYPDGSLIHDQRPIGLDDVIMAPQTRELVERVLLPFPRVAEQFRRRGLSAKKGVLFTGKPGTGKTLLCCALSNEMPVTCIWVTPRHGENEEAIPFIWRWARILAPTLIVLEDLDLFATDRRFGARAGALGELMNQMDGAEDNDGILTLATTNCLDSIEDAVQNRPGRFDEVHEFDGMEESGRRVLLSRYLVDDELEEGVLDTLVGESDGFSGAQVAHLAKTVLELLSHRQDHGSKGPARITLDMAQRAVGGQTSRKDGRMGFASKRAPRAEAS